MKILIYLIVIHLLVINNLEKTLLQSIVSNVNSPNDNCIGREKVTCLGMPSGHTEITTMLMSLLYMNGYVNELVFFLVVSIVGVQRILSNMNTFWQAVTGMFLGLVYGFLYMALGNSWYIFIVSILIATTLLFMTTVIVDRKVKTSMPDWLDNDLYYIVEKKRNQNLFVKMIHVYAPILLLWKEEAVHLSWKNMEKKIDVAIEMLGNEKYDVVIGMKSGGAILANYVGKKMGLPYYYIKLSSKCDNYNIADSGINLVKRITNIDLGKFNVCEGIEADLSGKKVLLLDEQITTGKSMKEAMSYLYGKGVGSIKIITLMCWMKDCSGFDIVVPNKDMYAVFPWGYDN